MEIADGISPKSVVSNGNGLFSAQNMMYRHSVTFYNTSGERLAKIADEIRPLDFGITGYGNGKYKGAPVEGVFTKNGQFLWVSNYLMTGEMLENPGCDSCVGTDYDPSFLYKINTDTYTIDNIIEVGSVPKFLAISPDQEILISSNWVSSDISIIDLESESEIKRVNVGPHPRGISISKDNKWAFVTIMGSTKIAQVNLETYAVSYITNVGKSPRSIILGDHDSTLYISLNNSNQILKYNRFTEEKVYCKTLRGPRSMILSPDENSLFVVNYFDDHFTKISTDSMQIAAEIKTSSKPIGISANWETSEIWVACYSGKLEIFKDFQLEKNKNKPSFFGIELTAATSKEQVTLDSNIIVIDTQETNLTIDTLSTTAVIEPKSHLLPPSRKENNIAQNQNGEDCSFHIIVGAFSSFENAENRKAELVEKGYSATILEGSKLNYVSAQCHPNKVSAEEAKKKISQPLIEYGSPWILER